jgi:SAM-dependent methyltransferase
MDRSGIADWDRRAEDWRIMPPLAPSAQDVAWYEERVGEVAAAHGSGGVAALLLGVTPSLVEMRWPARTSLVAVDWSSGMLGRVFPSGGGRLRAQAVRGDWRSLPFASASRDVVVGDGCYSALGCYRDAQRASQEVRRVLRGGGLFCLRCFARCDRPRSSDELYADLLGAPELDLQLFHWRLAIAVQGDSPEGVCVHDVWRTWQERVPDLRAEQQRRGWPAEPITAIDQSMLANWKESRLRYYVPNRSELRALALEVFDLIDDREVPGDAKDIGFLRLVMRAR